MKTCGKCKRRYFDFKKVSEELHEARLSRKKITFTRLYCVNGVDILIDENQEEMPVYIEVLGNIQEIICDLIMILDEDYGIKEIFNVEGQFALPDSHRDYCSRCNGPIWTKEELEEIEIRTAELKAWFAEGDSK
jgi:hypothetical protein